MAKVDKLLSLQKKLLKKLVCIYSGHDEKQINYANQQEIIYNIYKVLNS